MSEYEGILKAAKGGPGEKKLAAGFITRFFRHFPALADTAIDTLLDLIEDDDPQVSSGRGLYCNDVIVASPVCRFVGWLSRVFQISARVLLTSPSTPKWPTS